MPLVERLFHSPEEPPLIVGASTLRNRDEVYEMTRRHIKDGVPLGILIDKDGMSLVPTSDIVKTPTGILRWYEIKDGGVNPHMRVRFDENDKPPTKPNKNTLLLGIPGTDPQAYSGFTVVEVINKN